MVDAVSGSKATPHAPTDHGPTGYDPGEEFWPIRITSYAPSHRQFRLDEDLTPDQITSAVGVEPKVRPDGDKVTLQWTFWAELVFRLPDGGTGSTSIGCKIWDYSGSRWSAYGWPEAFEQIGLVPRLTKDYGSWAFEEDGNPTLAFLRKGLRAPLVDTHPEGRDVEQARCEA